VNDIKSDLANAADAIKESQTFLLMCHVNPDGDALGSTLAMAHALRNAGKKVTATFPPPFVIPHSLDVSLPEADLVLVPSDGIQGPFDVVMTFDCGSRLRLESLDRFFDDAHFVINVDHHISNERFGTINVIDVDAASSGSVVLDLLDTCGYELTREIAQCLYVALITDTGRFQFSSTTSRVFDHAKRLAAFDLPIAEMSRVLTEEDPFRFLKLAGDALSQMEFDEKARLVSAIATKEMQEKHDVAYDEVEGLIELVRRTREADVACVIKEFERNDYRVSLRSLGEIDVCEIASEFGGGGHRYAAGFSSTFPPVEIIRAVKNAVLTQRS
jgi:phosphoesterase RecJ-like protein